MKLKGGYWNLLPIIIVVGFIIYNQNRWSFEAKEFNDASLNNKIIKIEGNWSGGRSYDYITDSKVIITLLNDNKLYVGDSIVKKSKSWKFKVYRLDSLNNMYTFHKEYNLEDY